MKTILIADDEQDARTIICMRLAKHPHFRVVEATNGREALAHAREHHPDLIVLDWTMPGMSGIEVVRALRDLPGLATTPVIMTRDRKSTRLNSSHLVISYAVFCLKKKKKNLTYINLVEHNAVVCFEVISRDYDVLQPDEKYVRQRVVSTALACSVVTWYSRVST